MASRVDLPSMHWLYASALLVFVGCGGTPQQAVEDTTMPPEKAQESVSAPSDDSETSDADAESQGVPEDFTAYPPPPPPPRDEDSINAGSPASRTSSILPLNTPPPPPPPHDAPRIVPSRALEAQRLTGNILIHPSASITKTISKKGQRVITVEKMCLDAKGIVSSLTLLRSSGYPSYDAKLEGEMQSWTYRPFKVNGTAVPVCTAVTFIYLPSEPKSESKSKP
jgi:hypothetical protein